VPTDSNGTASAGPAVKIMGTKATLTIPHPIFRPTEYTIHPHHDGKPERHVVDIPGKGMHWQADATARAIRIEAMHIWLIVGDGKLETEILPVAETILMMEIMDRVREIGGLRYPDQIEKV
jgi:dihydrodiol dehydrogenase / D-xylose 1-dehydrogenase (NADP)